MPWYDYVCVECKHEEFDIKRSIFEEVSNYVCPKCNGRMTQKYSGLNFKLKGTGWFKDSYSNKSDSPTSKE